MVNADDCKRQRLKCVFSSFFVYDWRTNRILNFGYCMKTNKNLFYVNKNVIKYKYVYCE